MKKHLIIISIFLLKSFIVSAQKTVITGQIISQNSNILIPQAKIKIGRDSTTTNNFGEFSIAVDLNQDTKLLVSHTGYKDYIHTLDTTFYIIKLRELTVPLQDVTVQSNIKGLIKRIIEKLDSNYYNKSLHLKAITQLKLTMDSNRHFQSNAFLDVYSPPYNLPESKQIKIEANETNLVESSKDPMINWVQAYLIVNSFDIAHKGNRPDFLTEIGIKNYNYHIVAKELVAGKTNFHIVFNIISKNPKTTREEGYILVDSASLAITKARIIRYNIRHLGYIPKSKTASEIEYKNLNGHWIINNIYYESESIYQKLKPLSFINLKVIQYDTTNTKKIDYKYRIQPSDITQNIKVNPVNIEQKQILDSINQWNEKDSTIRNTSLEYSNKNKGAISIWHYLNSGNLKYSLAFGRLPVEIQSLNGISKANALGLEYSLSFKVLKNTFFEISRSTNISMKKVVVGAFDVSLVHDILINEKGHPFVLSPFVGYWNMAISDKTTNQKQHFNTLNIGSHLSYEINHRFSIVGTYKNFALIPQKSHLDNFTMQNSAYFIGLTYTR